MATSGKITVPVTKYDSLEFRWTRTNYSIESNTSTIYWELYLIATGAGKIISSIDKHCKVTVNGLIWESEVRINIENNQSKLLSAAYTTILHNADGSKTFSFSFEQEINVKFSGELIESCSGSGTGTLDNIPRGATLLSVTSFYDDESPTITYTNPAGEAVTSLEACIEIEGGGAVIPYRAISKTGTSYTFNFTQAEKEILWYQFLKGVKTTTVNFIIKTVIGNTALYSEFYGELRIRNASPVLAPVVVDTSQLAIALTGNPNTIIKGYNSVKVTANATAQKGATITSYLLANGGNQIAASEGYFTYTESPSFSIRASDDRGLITTRTVTMPMVDYTKLTCDLKASAEMAEETTARITMNIGGNYFNGSFGAKANSLAVKYRYKVNGGEYGEWQSVASPTIAGGRYTALVTIDVDYRNSYTVQALAVDAIYYGGVSSVEIPIKIVPVFDWSGEDFNFNVPVDINGTLFVSGRIYTESDLHTEAGITTDSDVDCYVLKASKIVIDNKELDYIVEQGAKDGWTYRKWNSGKGECWKILTLETDAEMQWGALWKGNYTARQNYPFSFTDKPVETVSLQSGGVGAMVIPADNGDGVNGAYASACYTICRPAMTQSQHYYLAFYVYGNWR